MCTYCLIANAFEVKQVLIAIPFIALDNFLAQSKKTEQKNFAYVHFARSDRSSQIRKKLHLSKQLKVSKKHAIEHCSWIFIDNSENIFSSGT